MKNIEVASASLQDTVNVLAGSISSRLLEIEGRIESIMNAIDPQPSTRDVEMIHTFDVPLRNNLNSAGYTIERVFLNLSSIESSLGISQSTQTSGQQTNGNATLPSNLSGLQIIELRKMIREEVKRMPRGFPGTGPRAKTPAPVAKKAASKAPAKATAKKVVAPAKKKAAVPAKAASRKKAA